MNPHNEPLHSWLIRHRTFAVSIGLVLAFGLSLMSWIQIPIEVMPKENTPPFLYLRVAAKDQMTPDQMELALTLPVEGAVRTQSNLMNFTSSTNRQGVSLSLTYKPRTNLDLAEFNLQETLQDLDGKGILDLRNVTISRLNPEATAVIKLSVTAAQPLKDPVRTMKEDLRIAFESVPEISKIELSGIEPLEYQYTLTTSQMTAQGLGQTGLSGFGNFQSIRDTLGNAPIGGSASMTAVNSRLILNDLDQLKQQTFTAKSHLALAQIASEKVVDKSVDEISRKNGSHAVFVEIFAKEGANLFDLKDHLNARLKGFAQDSGELRKLEFEEIFNKTNDLRQAIDDVFQSLYEAVAITFVVVFLFLQLWRPTLLISLSIPMTLLMTILILYARGCSLNILTLSGLILGIGMVVDSAVLVVGRIDELRAEGQSPKDAAANGARDVTSALLMSTLTNASIFLPVAFLEGGDSFTDILRAFQLPIVSSLASSLVVALLVLPVVMLLWRQKKTTNPIAHEDQAAQNVVAIFRWFGKKQFPVIAVVTGLVLFVASQVLDIAQTDLESPRDPYSTISVRFASEILPPQRRVAFEALENELLQGKDRLGYRFIVSDFNPELTTGTFMIYPKAGRDIDTILAALEKRVSRFLEKRESRPGILVALGWGGYAIGSSQQKSDILKLTGPKMNRLIQLSEDLKTRLVQIKGIESVKLEREESGDLGLYFIANETQLLSYDLTLPKISQELSALMSSVTLSNLNFNGKSVGARINLVPPEKTWTLEALQQTPVHLQDGRQIRLADLGLLVPATTAGSFSKKAGIATTKVSVYYQPASDEEIRKTQAVVRQTFQSFSFPLGYGPSKAEDRARIEEMQVKSQFIIGLAAFLIYLLLAAMFESILLPFAILFTVPLALLFGVAGLKALGMDLDVMARLSLIILVGIGVNGAIILIDLIRRLRSEGLRREDAIAIGCARRLKAVLMTSSIQIISVFPVAMGQAKIMGIPYSSLGISIISGMLFSTLITLIVLPIIYAWLDRVEQNLKNFLGIGRTSAEAPIESKKDQLQAA